MFRVLIAQNIYKGNRVIDKGEKIVIKETEKKEEVKRSIENIIKENGLYFQNINRKEEEESINQFLETAEMFEKEEIKDPYFISCKIGFELHGEVQKENKPLKVYGKEIESGDLWILTTLYVDYFKNKKEKEEIEKKEREENFNKAFHPDGNYESISNEKEQCMDW